MPARLAVLFSGSGRTLLNLQSHIDSGALDATIVRVVASRECPGAARARELGLPTGVVPGEISAGLLQGLLDNARVDLVVLAGYLRKIRVPKPYEGRVLNIHPAPLSVRDERDRPRFGGQGMWGRHVHEAVLAAFKNHEVAESGCTVHLVDDEYDHGPTLLERRCPIEPDDTPDTLAARVFELEQAAYPEAIAAHLESLAGGP